MATNNAINNTLPSPFTIGSTSVTSTGTQLNLLNGLTVVPINKVIVQTFTGNGTYTPTTGMKYCIAEGVGGGGGGGGSLGGAAGTASAGSGGGGGGYARVTLTAAQVGASQVVTIGALGAGGVAGNNNGSAGGDTSLGALLVAGGGGGGPGQASNSGAAAGIESVGGTATVGEVLIPGRGGQPGFVLAAGTMTYGGLGGESAMGAGGSTTQVTGTGLPGTGHGGGGSGGNSLTISRAGGDGSAGFMMITEFVSA